MTRKHYVLLAAALARTVPDHSKTENPAYYAGDQWRRDCEAIADALAADNARFDRARFLKACGVE